MKLLRRIRNIVKSNLNEAVAKAENPEKLLKQSISDMQDQAAKARAQVAHAIAAEKKLARLVAAAEAEAERATEGARAAAQAAAPDARTLVREHVAAQRRAEELHRQWNQQLESVAQLKAALAQLEAKIDEARRRKDVLVARKRLAQAKRDVHTSLAGIAETHSFLDAQAFEAFDRVAEEVDAAEAHAEAAAEVALQSFRPGASAFPASDVSDADVDAALARLGAAVKEAAAKEDG